MRTLEAINIALTAVGEPNVTSESAPSPSIGLIKNNLEHARARILERGWWFNDITMKLSPDIEGFIFVPATVIEVESLDDCVYVVRDTRLFNVQTQSYEFTTALSIRVLLDMPFDELPEMIAQYVAYDSAAQLYADDLGMDKNYENLVARRQDAYNRAFTQDLRNRKYTSSKSPRFRRLRSALYT